MCQFLTILRYIQKWDWKATSQIHQSGANLITRWIWFGHKFLMNRRLAKNQSREQTTSQASLRDASTIMAVNSLWCCHTITYQLYFKGAHSWKISRVMMFCCKTATYGNSTTQAPCDNHPWNIFVLQGIFSWRKTHSPWLIKLQCKTTLQQSTKDDCLLQYRTCKNTSTWILQGSSRIAEQTSSQLCRDIQKFTNWNLRLSVPWLFVTSFRRELRHPRP